MKLDITTEKAQDGYLFKIDNGYVSERHFSTKADAFSAGMEMVKYMRANNIALLMHDAFDKATDEERLCLGSLTNLKLIEIAKRDDIANE